MKLPATADLLIDGYNLLHVRYRRAPAKGPGNLERARNGLLRGIAATTPDPARVTVVFDARPEIRPLRPEQPEWTFFQGIRVAFAKGYTEADGYIADLCRTWPSPSRLWVVSDDRQVRDAARRCGARWLDCTGFLQRDSNNAKARQQPPVADKRDHAVNDAELQFWLNAFSGVKEEAAPPPPPVRPAPTGVIEPPKQKPRSISDPSLDDFYRDMLASETERE